MDQQKTLKEEWEDKQKAEFDSAVEELEKYIAKELDKLKKTLQAAANKDNPMEIIQELGNQLIAVYDQHLRLAIDFQQLAANSAQFQASTNLILNQVVNTLPKPALYNEPKIEIVKP